jgi:hypothetical protein
LCELATLRLIPAGPQVPRVVAVSDGVNLLAGLRIETGSIKATLEEVARPEDFRATVDGSEVEGLEIFCTDPQPRRFEVNFHIPASVGPGVHRLEMRLGRRRFAPLEIEVAGN